MLETCTTCGDETGRAGAGDDSLYLEDGTGPYCERCFEIRCLRAEVERLTYELKRCGDTGFRLNEAYVTEWAKDDGDEIERMRPVYEAAMVCHRLTQRNADLDGQMTAYAYEKLMGACLDATVPEDE